MNIIFLNSDQSIVARVAASPTSEVVWTAHYYDSGEEISEDSSNGELNGTTYVTLVASPTTKRGVKELSFYNPDSSSQTVEVSIDDDGTKRIIIKESVAAGKSLIFSKMQTLTIQGGSTLWQADGETKIKPLNDKLVDAEHLTGEISGGLFHP